MRVMTYLVVFTVMGVGETFINVKAVAIAVTSVASIAFAIVATINIFTNGVCRAVVQIGIAAFVNVNTV